MSANACRISAGVLLRAGNGNGLRGAEDPLHDRQLEDPVMHHEAHRPRDRAGEDQRVHVADVVADDDRRPVVGMLAMPSTRNRYNAFTSSQLRKRIRNSGTTVKM